MQFVKKLFQQYSNVFDFNMIGSKMKMLLFETAKENIRLKKNQILFFKK